MMVYKPELGYTEKNKCKIEWLNLHIQYLLIERILFYVYWISGKMTASSPRHLWLMKNNYFAYKASYSKKENKNVCFEPLGIWRVLHDQWQAVLSSNVFINPYK